VVARNDTVITADRARLEQAVGNLVDNALRHGEGSVLLDSAEEDGAVVVRVRDEGPGIPATLLSSAFDRFTRADAARSGGSTGLGLAIVQAIAHAHGGDAAAANAPSRGAVITMRFPVSG
jgi:signal transduction histidine kinase